MSLCLREECQIYIDAGKTIDKLNKENKVLKKRLTEALAKLEDNR